MKTIILPGFSAHNKEWAEAVAEKLQVKHEVRPIFWEHWTDPKKSFNPQKKAQGVIDLIGDGYANLIAKSVGTLVVALVLKAIPQKIKKVILCGIPTISGERLKIFQEAFVHFPSENVLVFQNTRDPFASFAEVKEFMSKVNPKIKVIKKGSNKVLIGGDVIVERGDKIEIPLKKMESFKDYIQIVGPITSLLIAAKAIGIIK